MRICIVIPYDLAEEGGVKRHGIRLAASLRRLGDEVDILGPSREPIMLPHVHAVRGVVNVSSNGSENHIGVFACPHLVRRLFHIRQYDVVHIHEPLIPSINYWALWSAGRAARVGTFHAFTEYEPAPLWYARRLWSAIAFRSYDRGIAVSPAAARLAREMFDKPLAIIPNGIDTSIYDRPISLPGRGPLRLLFVGHWRDRRKGLQYLLEACTRLTARGIAWTLDIVGDGGTAPRIENPNLCYHGAIASEQEIASLYAACDVFVAPAIGMESFGIVLLEAMASGRAIVCSNIEGYRYAAGDAAIFTPPQDSAALADAIGRLALDAPLRERLGRAARDRAYMFEWDRLALRVRAEYVAAIAQRYGDAAGRAHALGSARQPAALASRPT
jgi:phosphatidylinositol alpha-mannosyltransferase